MCLIKNENDLARFISYEWAVYPSSLFEENGMLRKTQKSKFKNVLPKPNSSLVNDPSMNYIIDGGVLLHHAIWPANLTYKQL